MASLVMEATLPNCGNVLKHRKECEITNTKSYWKQYDGIGETQMVQLKVSYKDNPHPSS